MGEDQTVPGAETTPYQPEVRPITPVREDLEDVKPVVPKVEPCHPGKYKQSILQRYLNDAYKNSTLHMPGGEGESSGTRQRNLSGSLSSYDYEEVGSVSSHGSPARETHDTEQTTEEGQWPYPIKREHDDLYWKEIGAALALTSLARCRPNPMAQEQWTRYHGNPLRLCAGNHGNMGAVDLKSDWQTDKLMW